MRFLKVCSIALFLILCPVTLVQPSLALEGDQDTEIPIIINETEGLETEHDPTFEYVLRVYQTEHDIVFECWKLIKIAELDLKGTRLEIEPNQDPLYTLELSSITGFSRDINGRNIFEKEILKKRGNECIPTKNDWKKLFKNQS